MPRKAKPPRLHLRSARDDRAATWVILDRGREIGTGCSESEREKAERALADYITEKYQVPETGGQLNRTLIADVVNVYVTEHAPTTERPELIATNADPILDWWGDKYLSDIRASTCKAYVKWRTKQPRKKRRSGLIAGSTARAELITLSGAIDYYHREYGPLTAIPAMTFPPPAQPREDYWLTRKQVADRIRAARRLKRNGHVIRLLLIGIYTGTRPGAAMQLRWIPSTSGGWFDLKTEVLHRRAQGEVESNKRKPKAKIHRRLLPWLHRWYKADMETGLTRRFTENGRRIKRTVKVTHVVHYGGKPIQKLRRSWGSVAIEAGHARQEGFDKHGKPIWIIPDGPHVCRHTAATWLMQSGVDKVEAAGYLGMSLKTLEEVYGHHHPDFQSHAASSDGRRRVRP
ncbi:hypothetical protein ACO2I3_06410 [Leptospira interrogans]